MMKYLINVMQRKHPINTFADVNEAYEQDMGLFQIDPIPDAAC